MGMNIDGFIDVANLAYILDWRGSTVEACVEEGNGLVPKPVRFCDVLLWPLPAIRQWIDLGSPMHWEYDVEEYSLLAWQECGADDQRVAYLHQRRRALSHN